MHFGHTQVQVADTSLMANWKTYYLVAKNTWDETLTYRLNFAVWRLRVFLSLITTYFLWVTLIPSGTSIVGYSHAIMLTYILGGSLVYSIVLSTRIATVADDIVQGNLSNYLLKPMSYLFYYFTKDLGDKGMNILFCLVELLFFFLLVKPPFFIQTNFLYILYFVLSLFLAVCINFFLNMILSFIGFFSSETWAPRFILFILLGFFAGNLFPLDILPGPVYLFLQALPFSYLIYAPMKIYLGQLPLWQVLLSLLIAFLWTMVLWIIVRITWSKGIRMYSAEGR